MCAGDCSRAAVRASRATEGAQSAPLPPGRPPQSSTVGTKALTRHALCPAARTAPPFLASPKHYLDTAAYLHASKQLEPLAASLTAFSLQEMWGPVS